MTFPTGWKDAIWSLPKRLFSAVPGAVNENSAFGSGDDTNFPSEVKCQKDLFLTLPSFNLGIGPINNCLARMISYLICKLKQ